MNQDIHPLDLVIRDISQSLSPVIVLTESPSLDAVYAALTLYIGLVKLGKSPSIASSGKITYNIRDISKITPQLSASGGENLVISFPYTDGSIDKVDYRIENNTFNLIVIPRPGYPKITPDQVTYSFAGSGADCLIAIGAPTLESFGRLYQENQNLFNTLPLVVMDNRSTTAQYGSSYFVDPSAASLCQLSLDILHSAQIQLDEAIATPAYNGIIAATNNFTSSNTDVSVFEQVAELMRLGAVREVSALPVQTQRTSQQNPPQNAPRQAPRQQNPNPQNRPQQGAPQRTNPNPQPQPQRTQKMQGEGSNQPRPMQQQNQRPNQSQQVSQRPAQQVPQQQPVAPIPAPQQPSSWIDTIPQDTSAPVPQVNQEASDTSTEDQKNAPQDWLKPKIYKGNGFI